jgi:PRC-barrel domain
MEVAMLERLDPLRGWTIESTDGEIGKVDDFLFDDDRWTVRYLQAQTGDWLNNRRVLLSPVSFDGVDRDRKRIRLSVTRDQVKRTPDLDARQPISRRYEADYYNYYGYPVYWGGANLWGAGTQARELGRATPPASFDPSRFSEKEFHLKRVSEVLGFHIRALDGEVGHVDDFLVDDDSWAIRYLLADTSNFIGGKWVVVSPEWARGVDWNALTVNLDMSKEQVKQSPEYDPNRPLDRTYETRVYDYYHRPTYWR